MMQLYLLVPNGMLGLFSQIRNLTINCVSIGAGVCYEAFLSDVHSTRKLRKLSCILA